MKKFLKILSAEKGLTLVEVLTSLVLLSVIAVTIQLLFVQSARSNQIATNMGDATTIAETEMEYINKLGTTATYSEALTSLTEDLGYSKTTQHCPNGDCFFTKVDDRFVFLQIKASNATVVKVYNDETRARQEAQMELLIPWRRT